MIERVVENLARVGSDLSFVFVVQQEDVSHFSLDRTLQILTSNQCKIISLRNATKGALCSALLAIDHLDMEAPLIVANGDQVIDADLMGITASFHAKNVDAGVILFDSVHPRWSYADIDESGNVVQAAEKKVISRHAIAGFYYFRTAGMFVSAAMRCIENNTSIDGHFFIAPCLNEIILTGGSVSSYHIPASVYHSFYSPEKIHAFEEGDLRRRIAGRGADGSFDVRVIIPAAGEGSRFQKAGYEKPKPFINVLGRRMLDHVIENVAPLNAEVHLLLRKDHIDNEIDAVSALRSHGHAIHQVDRLTEGTACTLLLARTVFDDDKALLVANSDQYVDFSVDAFVRDCIDRDLDGSILVFRDEERNPKWSFARLDESGLVREVAEKKPISDLATVGIYLFRRGSDFVGAAIDMIARNDRVNNEFYTCPVYNYMISLGLRIGVYEVPASAMHGLGTPEDLEAFITLREDCDVSLRSH